ncbi:unnamed protein product [Aphis gossypii]|uniref:Uncharacterized protein n=1 Tax=Aphis gossypii TaxID=80765 RepID=A0A9P0J0X9_APHGO|nr:unnamed protein product [Aphis gossypii]
MYYKRLPRLITVYTAKVLKKYTYGIGKNYKNVNKHTKYLANCLCNIKLFLGGLNGMGQAQSQSSFGDCNECSGQDYQTHSTHVINPHPEYFPPLRPLSSVSQNQNSRPFSESSTNRQSPGFQNGENRREHSINDQFPDTYSDLGTSNKLPGNQVHGYGIRPSPSGQYPGSDTNYKVADKQNQGYVINEQYPKSDTNNKLSDNQNYGYGIIPSVDNQYIGTGKNNQLPENQDNRYGIESPLYPGKIQGSKSNNNTELGKIDSGHVYNSVNEQIPNLVNTDTPEYKKNVNNDKAYPNSHSINSNPFNPSTWGYPNKIGNNNPNINPQIYLDGSGFPNTPPGSGQRVLTPHNTPNYDSIHPNYNRQIPETTSIEHQNKPSNSPSIHIPNYQHSIPNVLGQLTPNMPILSDMNSQNKQRIISEADGTILNGYPFSSDVHGGQGYAQLNIPSLCNFLYQTCLNALSNNKRLNEFQIANSQNNVGNSNTEKQIGNTQAPITHQIGFPLYGEGINQYQKQPNSGQPQYTIGSVGSSIQHPIFTETGGNINRLQSSYGQPQNTLGSGGSGVQQSGYAPSSGHVNQMQTGYGQPQSTLGSGGSGVQQSGYTPLGGNVNQMQTGYGQPQSTLGSSGSGVQQSGYAPSSGNVNQMQTGYGQPQSTLGSDGSGVQQSGYFPSSENVNQIQPNYGKPQGSLESGRSGVQQPGYFPSSGSVNQMQPGYGQPQSTLGSSGSGVQQSGYAPSSGNLNQMQPGYGQPQSTLGSSGSGVQQSGYAPSSGHINQMQPGYGQPQSTLGSSGSGVQQSGYAPSSGNVNQMQPGYGQPQSTLGSSGSGVQQSGYAPSSGNLNQMQPGYGQPQSTLGSGGSGVQQSGYTPAGGNVNQMQPESYGDNSFRGPSFKPRSEMGNINPSTNPIIGGQFGTDISSGGSVIPIDTEGGDAQSMTNVDVDGQETRASASAQGKSKTGMSQTQVSGSYLGTGTFSAQAQTSDSDKGAQSQIVSNTNGTTSTAQGKGGRGQAQSQVLYNADNGIALGEAQSSGINYGTNTQLQAGIKGGMADAQSTGLGSTSSQAQIGFLPHESNNSTNQKSLFKGGGTTSAQGGSHSGQSQSQLFGSFKHGISYNGAAQASSGKKLQNLPKLNLADAKLKIGQMEGSNNEVKNQTNALKNLQFIPNLIRSQNQTENSRIDIPKQQNISSTQTPPPILPQESSKNADIYPEYEDNDEYDDDSDEIINTKSVQTKKETTPKQEQNIILNLDDKHDAQITRDSASQLKSGQVLDAGQVIPGTNGTKIPSGFRGRVASVAGDHTEAQAIPGGQAQTQTVFLSPGAGSLTVVDKTKLRAQLNKESYVSPNTFQTKINGGISKFKPNENNVQYFTKSSTCGYFSFSCNYVNGATNGAKICKPNPPPFPCLKSN